MNKWKVATIILAVLLVGSIINIVYWGWATSIVWEERDFLIEENYNLSCMNVCFYFGYDVYDNQYSSEGICTCTEPSYLTEDNPDMIIFDLEDNIWTSKTNQWFPSKDYYFDK